MGFFGKKLVDEKVIKLLLEISQGKDEFLDTINKRCLAKEGFIDILQIQIKELQEKVEILENEKKTQDDIIIEKLEKSSWKGKKK